MWCARHSEAHSILLFPQHMVSTPSNHGQYHPFCTSHAWHVYVSPTCPEGRHSSLHPYQFSNPRQNLPLTESNFHSRGESHANLVTDKTRNLKQMPKWIFFAGTIWCSLHLNIVLLLLIFPHLKCPDFSVKVEIFVISALSSSFY